MNQFIKSGVKRSDEGFVYILLSVHSTNAVQFRALYLLRIIITYLELSKGGTAPKPRLLV